MSVNLPPCAAKRVTTMCSAGNSSKAVLIVRMIKDLSAIHVEVKRTERLNINGAISWVTRV